MTHPLTKCRLTSLDLLRFYDVCRRMFVTKETVHGLKACLFVGTFDTNSVACSVITVVRSTQPNTVKYNTTVASIEKYCCCHFLQSPKYCGALYRGTPMCLGTPGESTAQKADVVWKILRRNLQCLKDACETNNLRLVLREFET